MSLILGSSALDGGGGTDGSSKRYKLTTTASSSTTLVTETVTSNYPYYLNVKVNSYDGFVLISYDKYTSASKYSTVTGRLTSAMQYSTVKGGSCVQLSDSRHALFQYDGTVNLIDFENLGTSYGSFSSGYNGIRHALLAGGKVYITSNEKLIALDAVDLLNKTVTATEITSISYYNNLGFISDSDWCVTYIQEPLSASPYSIWAKVYSTDGVSQYNRQWIIPSVTNIVSPRCEFTTTPCCSSSYDKVFICALMAYHQVTVDANNALSYLTRYRIYLADVLNYVAIPIFSDFIYEIIYSVGMNNTSYPNISIVPWGDKFLIGICSSYLNSSSNVYSEIELYLYDPVAQKTVGYITNSLGGHNKNTGIMALGTFDNDTAVCVYTTYSSSKSILRAFKITKTEV